MFFELCTRAHFFCFHPKIAVPCTILILGPVTSRCLRRPCWVLRAACSTKTAMNHIRSQKMFFFQFFFPCVLRATCRTITAICRPSLRPKSAVTSRCLRRPCWAVPRCSLNFVHALTSFFFIQKSPDPEVVACAVPLKVGA